jgi:hypothetical protein
VQLEGDDLDRANNHYANAIRELEQLSKLVAQALGRDYDRGFTSVAVAHPSNARQDQPVDVTVTVFCHGHDCAGVYDAVKGVCRPCGPGEAGVC